jgi:pimeloyl-ACP methyl ester carboxylesterase
MTNAQHSDTLQVRPITILVHGIRTFGSWQERLRRLLEEQCNQDVVIFRYGYLDVLAFIIPFARRFAIKRFTQYLDENADTLRNRQINLVAHSFGTYVIAWVLLRDARRLTLNVNTVILCGSVLRQFFPWQRLTRDKTVGRVINDCGTKDMWPLMAQCFVLGLGAAGRYGFAGPLGSAVGIYNRYFPFGHDGFFAEQQMAEYWLPLLRGGASPNGHELMPPSWHRLVGFEQYGDPIKALPLLAVCAWIVKRHAILTPDRRPNLTPLDRALFSH